AARILKGWRMPGCCSRKCWVTPTTSDFTPSKPGPAARRWETFLKHSPICPSSVPPSTSTGPWEVYRIDWSGGCRDDQAQTCLRKAFTGRRHTNPGGAVMAARPDQEARGRREIVVHDEHEAAPARQVQGV